MKLKSWQHKAITRAQPEETKNYVKKSPHEPLIKAKLTEASGSLQIRPWGLSTTLMMRYDDEAWKLRAPFILLHLSPGKTMKYAERNVYYF